MPKGDNLKNGNVGIETRFKEGKDERRNTKGAFNPLSKILKELSESNSISYTLEIKQKDGTIKTVSNSITSKDDASIMEIVAVQLLAKAATGDLRAIEMVRDSTEGKPRQAIDFTKDDESISPITIFQIPSNGR